MVSAPSIPLPVPHHPLSTTTSGLIFPPNLAPFTGFGASGEWWLFFVIMFIGWLVLMLVWMTRLNKALALFDPILYIPLVQSNFILWSIIGGGP